MSDPLHPSIADLLADHDLITAAVNRAVREAVLKHARAGKPVAVGQDGKVVWISAAEILQSAGELQAGGTHGISSAHTV
jgi:hypothetical protein